MKKVLFPAIMVVSLLLSACQSQTASPQETATFCADLTVFMNSVEEFANLGADASKEEYLAAYTKAVAAGSKLHESSLPLKKEPGVEEFSKAAQNLAVSLDYARETLPGTANYLQTMADIKQQYQDLLVAYKDIEQSVCTP